MDNSPVICGSQLRCAAAAADVPLLQPMADCNAV